MSSQGGVSKAKKCRLRFPRVIFSHLSGQAEDLLHQLLSLGRLLQEELDDGGQESELHLQVKRRLGQENPKCV